MGYDINWSSVISPPFPTENEYYQKFSTLPIGMLDLAGLKTAIDSMPLNPQTAPIVGYLCTLLRIRALTA